MKLHHLPLAAVAAIGLAGCQSTTGDRMDTASASDGMTTSGSNRTTGSGDTMGSGMAGSSSATAPGSMSTSMVGGTAMYSNRTIVENASMSPIHKQLVAALTASGLVPTLSGAGPFTVFAPTDEAFGRLDATQLNNLMQPAQRDQLVALLSYHVVPGRITAADLAARLAAGGGTATLTTVQGSPITVMKVGNAIELTGVNGGKSYITQADVMQSNGVIHVVNGILVPSV